MKLSLAALNEFHLMVRQLRFLCLSSLFVVMDNFKNVPQYLYGLSPSQMDMFMTEDNPVRRQSERVTEVCFFNLY